MANIDGAWNCTVSSPMGPQVTVMTIRSDGDTFTGTNTGPLGSIDVTDGRIEGDTVTFRMSLTVPMPIELAGKATIDGDKLAGTVTAGAFGSWPLVGTRA